MPHKPGKTRSDYTRKWRAEHPEEYKRRNKSWYARNGRGLHLKNTYGITAEDYNAMMERQGGVCAICGAPPSETRSLNVDHDHETGAIRGLLCTLCNTHLEWFAQHQAGAVAYLSALATQERLGQ